MNLQRIDQSIYILADLISEYDSELATLENPQESSEVLKCEKINLVTGILRQIKDELENEDLRIAETVSKHVEEERDRASKKHAKFEESVPLLNRKWAEGNRGQYLSTIPKKETVKANNSVPPFVCLTIAFLFGVLLTLAYVYWTFDEPCSDIVGHSYRDMIGIFSGNRSNWYALFL